MPLRTREPSSAGGGSDRPPLRVLELFCGIGGCAAALPAQAQVVAAVDIDRRALAVYGHNFPHPRWCRAIESLRVAEVAALGADLWWLSPPCQPHTRRGHGRDLDDPRSAGLRHAVDLLSALHPRWLALENVPGFESSRSHELLLGTLERLGYEVEEMQLCPTELGIPNRRRRYYLLASLGDPPSVSAPRPAPRRVARPDPRALPRPKLADFLDPQPDPDLRVEPALLARYARAVDCVDAAAPGALAATFTSAYGRSPVYSGSYLKHGPSWRRATPTEVLRLLGFPAWYRLPADLPRRTGWALAGNSLSVTAVRHVLAAIPELAIGAAIDHATPDAQAAASLGG